MANKHKQGTKLRSTNLRFALLTLPQIGSTTFGPCCGRYVYGKNLTMFEMINTVLALLAVVISLVALIRTRKVSEQQKVLTTQAKIEFQL
ncbi:hypothetical protein [Vibrio fluvialis]|uniref:hypothetical protein n=1 Tax=Vibrio fluvialis TaxID=676 RepID=UPI00301E17AA